MQTEKQRVLAIAAVCLLIAGSGVVVGAKYGQPSHDQTTRKESTHGNLRVQFANDSTVVIHGTAKRVGIGTAWYAPDGAATSHFEYGPVNGTTRIDVPNQGTRTTITYVTVHNDGQATPILTAQHSTTMESPTNSSTCGSSSPDHRAASVPL